MEAADGNLTLTARRIDPTTYEEWKSGVFTPEEQANPAISGPLADPEGDGLVNLFEYVHDGRPKVRDAPRVARDVVLNEVGRVASVELSFPWANGMSDARYKVEQSSDLVNWSPAAGNVSRVDEGVTEAVSVRVQFDGAVDGAYLRLVAELE